MIEPAAAGERSENTRSLLHAGAKRRRPPSPSNARAKRNRVAPSCVPEVPSAKSAIGFLVGLCGLAFHTTFWYGLKIGDAQLHCGADPDGRPRSTR